MTCANLERLEERSLLSAPILSNYTASKMIAAVGEPIVLTVTASSSAGMGAASFFVDMNGNGGWDRGVDIGLGDVFAPAISPQVTLQKTVAMTTQWPVRAPIYANVMNRNHEWLAQPVGLTIGRQAPPPTVNFVSATQNTIAPGESFQLSLSASSTIPLVAATFFVDLDRDGRYGRGADIPLGDVWQPMPGTSTYRLTTTAAWDWGYALGLNNLTELLDTGVQIRGNVVDVNGTWGTAPAATLMQLVPRPNLLSLSATGTAATAQLTASASAYAVGGWGGPRLGDANGLRDITFFYDANRNGRFDTGDATVGTVPFLPGGSTTLTLSVSTPTTWAFPRQFGAFATDTRTQGNGTSDTRVAVIYGDNTVLDNVSATVASIRRIHTTLPLDFMITAGDSIGLDAVVQPATGSSVGLLSAIAFYDNDHNGRFDPTHDQLIEEQSVNRLGQTARFIFNIDNPTNATGQVQVAIAAKDEQGRIGSAKSWIALVGRKPDVQNIQTSIITQGSSRSLRVSLDASDGNISVREIDAILDPRSASAFVPSSGTQQNGHWVLSIDLAGMSSGSHDLWLRISNIYRREQMIRVQVVI